MVCASLDNAIKLHLQMVCVFFCGGRCARESLVLQQNCICKWCAFRGEMVGRMRGEGGKGGEGERANEQKPAALHAEQWGRPSPSGQTCRMYSQCKKSALFFRITDKPTRSNGGAGVWPRSSIPAPGHPTTRHPHQPHRHEPFFAERLSQKIPHTERPKTALTRNASHGDPKCP